MDPVGQASSACNACRRSALETGWALTKDVSAASPKTAGAICRQASQSMQVESTKKSPGTFSGTRFLGICHDRAFFCWLSVAIVLHPHGCHASTQGHQPWCCGEF